MTDQRVDHTFLVRIWRERTKTRASDWRGSAKHISTGDTIYFSRFADLEAFVDQYLAGERDELHG